MTDTFTAAQKLQVRQRCICAIRTGKLIRQPCEACGSTEKTEAHHEDYSKPFQVKWLCRGCHRAAHGGDFGGGGGTRHRSRRPFCSRGHAMSGHNLMLTASGTKPRCRQCRNDAERRRRKASKNPTRIHHHSRHRGKT